MNKIFAQILIYNILLAFSGDIWATFGDAGDEVYASDETMIYENNHSPLANRPWVQQWPQYPTDPSFYTRVTDERLQPREEFERFAYNVFGSALGSAYQNPVIKRYVSQRVNQFIAGIDIEVRIQPANQCRTNGGHSWHIDDCLLSVVSRADLRGAPTEYAIYPGSYDNLVFTEAYPENVLAPLDEDYTLTTYNHLTAVHFGSQSFQAGFIPSLHRGPPQSGGSPRAIITAVGIGHPEVYPRLLMLRLVDRVETDENRVHGYAEYLTNAQAEHPLTAFVSMHMCRNRDIQRAYQNAYNTIVQQAPRSFQRATQSNTVLGECIDILFRDPYTPSASPGGHP